VFGELLKELKRLERATKVSIPIRSDEKDYMDRQCPAENCEFLFKVHEEDWTNIFKDEAVWCPFCRHEAPSDQWFTKAQIKHAEAEALAMIEGRISKAMLADTRKFNRQQPRNSFISMSMDVTGSTKRTHVIPARAAELMRLEIACEKCSSRFAVIGSAYFCPACGHNSVLQTFSDSLRKIKAKKDSIPIVRQAICEASGKDDAEITCRSMIESCLQDGVVGFQRYCEGMYEPFGSSSLNTFQRLDQGSEYWKNAVGSGYEDWLSIDELSSLVILFQKRHLLSHSEGIVDARYIQKSKDRTYKEGQRIVVTGIDIDYLVYLVSKLSNNIRDACGKSY
jgi:RNA polymerase subunit RPABC4/transcription elongation factor Spt4|tara:strand:- start:767 stop:1777 length:1011 start_codon:yes stop_codon:yes gene_type:complete